MSEIRLMLVIGWVIVLNHIPLKLLEVAHFFPVDIVVTCAAAREHELEAALVALVKRRLVGRLLAIFSRHGPEGAILIDADEHAFLKVSGSA